MVYRGENVLVVESKIQEGCRVLLTREDLMRLLTLETRILQKIDSFRKEKPKKESVRRYSPILSPPPAGGYDIPDSWKGEWPRRQNIPTEDQTIKRLEDSPQPTPPIIQSYSPMSPPRRTPPPFREPWSSYPPIHPRQTRKEEEAVDPNNTFATPSLGEELDMTEYLNFNKTL